MKALRRAAYWLLTVAGISMSGSSLYFFYSALSSLSNNDLSGAISIAYAMALLLGGIGSFKASERVEEAEAKG